MPKFDKIRQDTSCSKTDVGKRRWAERSCPGFFSGVVTVVCLSWFSVSLTLQADELFITGATGRAYSPLGNAEALTETTHAEDIVTPPTEFIGGCPVQSKTLNTDQCIPVSRRPLLMSTLFLDGISVIGAQYWIFIGSIQFHFPEDVQWGFYPEDVSEETIDCAEKSFSFLKQRIASGWSLMQQAVSLGATNKIYLLMSDYTVSASTRRERRSHLWHSAGRERDYHLGYWVWESTVTKEGECQIPDQEEIQAALRAAVASL